MKFIKVNLLRDRKSLLFLLALTIILSLVYLFIFDNKLFLGGDNAFYYILGQSLHNNWEYRNIHMPGHPLANHFPPGYSFLIALEMFFSKSVIWIKVCNGLWLYGSLILIYLIVRQFTSNKLFSIFCATLTMLNTQILKFSFIMMSEMSFLFFSLLTLLFVLKSDKKKNEFNRYLFLSIGSLIFSFYIRTQGVALLGGVAILYLLRKKWRSLFITVAGVCMGVIPWFLRGQSLGGNGYINQLILKKSI
ncbi:hypothetical protein K4L44_00345 [Halosquirtibacter laminarini]|uniref:Uncharacterized protein n=1 Tax=Halosquirtibacter laminarini TaxID=3374600 RepID=A0AC61NN58_9BACT|nr:hypothetical protein K4L44_00345 [Prolixibacteraceae bacterium]